MSEISKYEYAARTQAVAKAVTDFGDAWKKLYEACENFGITEEEFEKKIVMDDAVYDFMDTVNKRLTLVINGLSKGDEDDD